MQSQTAIVATVLSHLCLALSFCVFVQEHPGIVCYMESFVDRKSMELCIVMSYADGGDLASFLKTKKSAHAAGGPKLSEAEIKLHFVQVALALHFMHEKNILHRDLKTGNIFLKNDLLLLGDFGISKVLNGATDLASTCIGTPYYMSPELFKNKPYNHKSDVFALGCVLYELTCLKHAFDADNINALASKVINGVYPPISTSYSKELRELIRTMLGVTPSSRPSMKSILLLPCLYKSIKKYISKLLAEYTPASDSPAPALPSSSPWRPSHVLNLRNQLDRLGAPLSNIFTEIEKERADKKAGSGNVEKNTAAGPQKRSRPPAAAALTPGEDELDSPEFGPAAAASAPGADDTIAATLVAAPKSGAAPRRSRREKNERKADAMGAGMPSSAAGAIVAAVGGKMKRPGKLVRHDARAEIIAGVAEHEHALRLEELKLEEEAKRKLEKDFERLQNIQAQRAKRLAAKKKQLSVQEANNNSNKDSLTHLRPSAVDAVDPSIATTSPSSASGSGSNFPVIVSSNNNSSGGGAPTSAVSPLQQPQQPPLQQQQQQQEKSSFSSSGGGGGGGGVVGGGASSSFPVIAPGASREHSRNPSPALANSASRNKLTNNNNNNPQQPKGPAGAAVAGINSVAAAAAGAGFSRPVSPGGSFLPSVSASGSGSAASSPRLRGAVGSHKVFPGTNQGSAQQEAKESESSSPARMLSAAQGVHHPAPSLLHSPFSDPGTDEHAQAAAKSAHLKLLKRKTAHASSGGGLGVASGSGGRPSPDPSPSPRASPIPSPRTRAAPNPQQDPPQISISVTSIADDTPVGPLSSRSRARQARLRGPGAPAAAAAAAAAPSSSAASVVSPPPSVDSRILTEKEELERLRMERMRLEHVLTKMDEEHGLFLAAAAAAGGQPNSAANSASAHSVVALSAAAGPPQVIRAASMGVFPLNSISPPSSSLDRQGKIVASSPPPLHPNQPAVSFSASTLLPSAFDAPLIYKHQRVLGGGSGGGGAVVAPVAQRSTRRNSTSATDDSSPLTAISGGATNNTNNTVAATVDSGRASPKPHSSSPKLGPRVRNPFGAAGGSGGSSVAGVVDADSPPLPGSLSTKDRVLAAKRAQHAASSAQEEVKLLAARKEYFAARVNADRRTKEFYGINTGGTATNNTAAAVAAQQVPPVSAGGIAPYSNPALAAPGAPKRGSSEPPGHFHSGGRHAAGSLPSPRNRDVGVNWASSGSERGPASYNAARDRGEGYIGAATAASLGARPYEERSNYAGATTAANLGGASYPSSSSALGSGAVGYSALNSGGVGGGVHLSGSPPPSAPATDSENLFIYDDSALDAHLNADIISPSSAGMAQLASEEAELAASRQQVLAFQSHLEQYTRRIETLRQDIEIKAREAALARKRVAAVASGAAQGGYYHNYDPAVGAHTYLQHRKMDSNHYDTSGSEREDSDGGGGSGDEGADPHHYSYYEDGSAAFGPASSWSSAGGGLGGGGGGGVGGGAASRTPFSIEERKRALTRECVELVGKETFVRAFDFLRAAQADPNYATDIDDVRKIAQLSRIMNAEKVKHWKLIDLLAFMESEEPGATAAAGIAAQQVPVA
jgi:hypothetical protein